MNKIEDYLWKITDMVFPLLMLLMYLMFIIALVTLAIALFKLLK